MHKIKILNISLNQYKCLYSHSSFLCIFHIIFWRFKLKLKTVIIIARYVFHVIVAYTNFTYITYIWRIKWK